MPKHRDSVCVSILRREIMISTDTKDPFKLLLGEPVIDRSQVRSIVVESVAKISTMNQHVARQRTKFFVFAMSVTY